MTQYYALAGASPPNSVRVVIHLAVPAGNNAAGVSWQSVAPDYKASRTENGTVSVVPTSMLEAGAQAALDAGSLYEHEFRVPDDFNAAPATRLTNLETAVAAEAVIELAILQDQLNYWGQKGDA
jgi:hypothetical protein